MDYHSIHGHDIASFDPPSSHRLPTVSASAAQHELDNDPSAYIPTGLKALDKALESEASRDKDISGGIRRGQVTEIWGPPGAGKAALGIQLTANAICDGHGVVWVDCFQSLPEQRVRHVITAVCSRQTEAAVNNQVNESTAQFIRYDCLTLPHLMALIARPTKTSIPMNTSLVVFSNITALLNSALPKSQDRGIGIKKIKGTDPSARRRQALQSIMKALKTLALTRNCAVVLLSQCATKMQFERSASLTPAVNAAVWCQGVSTQIVLFRDWNSSRDDSENIFFAGVQKANDKTTEHALGLISAFKINPEGIADTPCTGFRGDPPIDAGKMNRQKRKLGNTDFEVPDSEDDEDYGWADEDEASLPAPPPQWQGSEDILLGTDVGRSEDGTEVEDGNQDGGEDGDESKN